VSHYILRVTALHTTERLIIPIQRTENIPCAFPTRVVLGKEEASLYKLLVFVPIPVIPSRKVLNQETVTQHPLLSSSHAPV